MSPLDVGCLILDSRIVYIYSLAVVPHERDLLALHPQEPEDVLDSGLCHFFVRGVSEIELVADPHRLVLPLRIAIALYHKENRIQSYTHTPDTTKRAGKGTRGQGQRKQEKANKEAARLDNTT